MGAAGSGIAFAAACAIRRVWSNSIRIISMDINPEYLVTASILSDEFIQVPALEAPNYTEKLIDLIKTKNVGFYLPLLPKELVIASNLVSSGKLGNNVIIFAPSPEITSLCADKFALMLFLKNNGIPVPLTAKVSKPFVSNKYFIKPRDGSGSIGARCINASELSKFIDNNADDYILQDICESPEVTVDVFFCANKSFIKVICRERLEIKSGVSTKCRIFNDDNITELAKNIALLLGISGVFCFQIMRNNGDWVVTDVNPRPGAGTAMSLATGNDFFASTFAMAFGEDYTRFFFKLDREYIVTRQYSEYVMQY